MTVDTRPDVFAVARSVLDEAFADFADESLAIAEAFVPEVPPGLGYHYCPDGICADLAAERAAIHQAADWRSLAAWARGEKAKTRSRKTARGKKVKALRRQVAGQT